MNILKFINKTKTPFIPLYCTLNENEKKEYYVQKNKMHSHYLYCKKCFHIIKNNYYI